MLKMANYYDVPISSHEYMNTTYNAGDIVFISNAFDIFYNNIDEHIRDLQIVIPCVLAKINHVNFDSNDVPFMVTVMTSYNGMLCQNSIALPCIVKNVSEYYLKHFSAVKIQRALRSSFLDRPSLPTTMIADTDLHEVSALD